MHKRWLVGAGVALVLFEAIFVYSIAEQRVFNNLLDGMRSTEVAAEQKLLAESTQDIYGGATPEETVSLYIQAIEQQNYALASRYFILEKYDKEFKNFLTADLYARDAYLQIVKQLQPGTYSEDGTLYTMRAELDGPDFFARFRKYPHNLWKIIEI